MLCYLLAFGSKEQAIIFPLNLFVFDYLFNRFKGLKTSWGLFGSRLILEKLPFFLAVLFLWYFSLQNNLGGFESNSYPLSQRLLIGPHSLMMYIFRFLVPAKLYYYYFYPAVPGGTIPAYYWIYPVLLVFAGFFLYKNVQQRNKLAVAGAMFFIINLLLVLHILPMPRNYATADRFMYLSIIGAALILVWLGYYIVAKFKNARTWFIPMLVLYFLFFGVHSFYRTTKWKNSGAIKKDIVDLLEKRKAKNLPVNINPLDKNE